MERLVLLSRRSTPASGYVMVHTSANVLVLLLLTFAGTLALFYLLTIMSHTGTKVEGRTRRVLIAFLTLPWLTLQPLLHSSFRPSFPRSERKSGGPASTAVSELRGSAAGP